MQKLLKSYARCSLFNYNKNDISKTPYLHNFVPLRRDIRWDKDSHMKTEIIHRTQVSFLPNWAHMNRPKIIFVEIL